MYGSLKRVKARRTCRDRARGSKWLHSCTDAVRYRPCISSADLPAFPKLRRIVRIGDRQLRAVGVVRMIRRTGLKDLREALLIFFGKAISCTFSRCGFEVVHVSCFFLEHDHLVADEIKHFGGKGVASFRRNIFFVLCEVADHFIDAVHTDRREVITQRAR